MLRRRIPTAIAAAGAALLLAFAGAPAQAAVGDIVTVTGTVTDSNGVPQAGQFVSLSAFPGDSAFAVTDENGAYTVDFVMSGDEQFPFLSLPGSMAQCEPLPIFTGPATLTSNCVVPILWTVTVNGVATPDTGVDNSFAFISARDNTGTGYGATMPNPDFTYSLIVTVPDTATAITIVAPGGDEVATLTEFADGDVIDGVDFTYHPPATWEPATALLVGTVTTKRGQPSAGTKVEFTGGGPEPVSTVTGADGTYSLEIETYWNDEVADGSDGFISIDGAMAEFVENIAPESTYGYDHRLGKTPVFSTFVEDVDMRGDGMVLADVLRKINKDGTAEWAGCTEWACTGANFGTRKTEYLGLTPNDGAVGSTFLLFRDTSGPEASWLRIEPDMMFAEQATFGPRHLDGSDYFDFQGDGPIDFVAWADKRGVTTVWTWGPYDGIDGVEETSVDGRFVSAAHLDLDAVPGEELVLVTRRGGTYTVTLLASSTADPEVVATGKGAPTVTFEDADGDLVFDIVVTYPERH